MKRFFTGLFGFTMAFLTIAGALWLAYLIVGQIHLHSSLLKIILFFVIATALSGLTGLVFGGISNIVSRQKTVR